MKTLTTSLTYLSLVILLTIATTAQQARGEMAYISSYESISGEYGWETSTIYSVDLSNGSFSDPLWTYDGQIYAMDYSLSDNTLVAVGNLGAFSYGEYESDKLNVLRTITNLENGEYSDADLPDYYSYVDASLSISRHGDNTLLYFPQDPTLYDLAQWNGDTTLPDIGVIDCHYTGLAHHPYNENMYYIAHVGGALYYGDLETVGDPTHIDPIEGDLSPGSITAMDFAPFGDADPANPWPWVQLYTVWRDNDSYYISGYDSDLNERVTWPIPVSGTVESIAIVPVPGAVTLAMIGLGTAVSVLHRRKALR